MRLALSLGLLSAVASANPVIRIGLVILITMLLMLVSHRIIEVIVRRLVSQHHFESKADERKREDTLIKVLGTATAVLLWLISFLVILDALGVNLAAAATGAGLQPGTAGRRARRNSGP